MIARIVTLSLLLGACSAKAQILASNANPIIVAPGASSNAPVGTFSIYCDRQQNVAVQWTCIVGGTDVTNAGVVFIPVVDAGIRPSTPNLADGFFMTRLVGGGTTNTVVVTNFNVKGYSRLDLYCITNNSATFYITNNFAYTVKPNAP